MFLLLCLYMRQTMFLMKTKWIFFWTACLVGMLSSCLKTEDAIQIELTRNCQIKSFTLSSDSVAELSSVKFTIDQLTGRIFNIDSLPYGTKIEKVYCTLTTASSYDVNSVEVSPYAYPDSTYYLQSLSDSIDFSAPVKFVMHAYDGITTKTYIAQVNIHQIEPDTMIWTEAANPMLPVAIREQKTIKMEQEGDATYLMYVQPTTDEGYQLYQATESDPTYWEPLSLTGLPTEGVCLSQMTYYNKVWYVATEAGTLYRSADGQTWSEVAGAPAIRILLGEIPAGLRQAAVLTAVVEQEGALVYGVMDEAAQWTMGDVVPEHFPASGFSTMSYESMHYQYLMVVAGRSISNQLLNTTWTSRDGLTWAQLGASSKSFSPREGIMMTRYDDQLLLIGGVDADQQGLKDMYSSIDFGLNWTLVDSTLILPEAYEGRGFSSVWVDKQHFVNLFGGKTKRDANDMNQLWRGRINRLIPKE